MIHFQQNNRVGHIKCIKQGNKEVLVVGSIQNNRKGKDTFNSVAD